MIVGHIIKKMFAHKVFDPYSIRHRYSKEDLMIHMDAAFKQYSQSRLLIGAIKEQWSEFIEN